MYADEDEDVPYYRYPHMRVEASEIVPGLWQGSKPVYGRTVADAGFHTLVLCAREYQPASVYFPKVTVVHAPNDDNAEEYPFTVEKLKVAIAASSEVVKALQNGQRVLVTCAAGINRSGLVTALSLHRLYGWSGVDCIQHVRRKRGKRGHLWPLSNPDFTRVLRRLPVHQGTYPVDLKAFGVDIPQL